ncbi:hypothetical protein FDP25_06285 [Roseovarius sp. A21]|uniref:PH domain-containing protein n=1 Tax=Roseovarius bejariae TaxID=2576383 RepID=A0A844CNJ1_9RHOB|nr:hypothetical protein [Roseovarius bejariae]MRU15035.1 hypothetical protein [Roseovarius bejariae]
MSGVSIDVFSHGELNTILDADEHVIWTGRPEYGRRFFQPIGAERTRLISMIFGALAMWSTLPFIPDNASFGRFDAIWVYSAASLAFLCTAMWSAHERQTVLCTLLYFVTNKRSIVCRRGRNWHAGTRLYVVSNAHSATYPYEIFATRPHPSLRVGTLLDQQELNPFGFGLSHSGQPVHWGALTVPVAFEQVPNAAELLAMINSNLGYD